MCSDEKAIVECPCTDEFRVQIIYCIVTEFNHQAYPALTFHSEVFVQCYSGWLERASIGAVPYPPPPYGPIMIKDHSPHLICVQSVRKIET